MVVGPILLVWGGKAPDHQCPRTADPDSVLGMLASVLAVLAVALFAKEVLYQRMGGVDYTPPAASAVVAEIPHANHLCH